MSEVETNQEQIENKVERRAGKRGRSKSSLDRTIEESEAITKSLGPEPEIAEGRRRTRSSTKGLTAIEKVETTPPPAKKEKKTTPKTGRGRGRKPLKKDESNENEVEENATITSAVVNNNESNANESENISTIAESGNVNETGRVVVVDGSGDQTNGDTSKEISVAENGSDIVEDKKPDEKPEPMVTSDSASDEVVEKKDSSNTVAVSEPEDKQQSSPMVVDKNGTIDAIDAKVDKEESSAPTTEVVDSKIESENTKTD